MAKAVYSFMIDADLAASLKRIKARDGMPEGEQIRRALRDWFRRKGLAVKKPPPARTRAKKGQ
jgi:hypothetical protein